MSFTYDPHGYWLLDWEKHNPEPRVFEDGPTPPEMMLRHVKWLDQRWEAFALAYPEYKLGLVHKFRE